MKVAKPQASAPHYEVERKYCLTAEEFANLPRRLSEEMGFESAGQVVQTDTFLPVENRGDIIRVRDERCGDQTDHLLTLKTWVVVNGHRERREQEEHLSRTVRDCLVGVAERLNGRPLPTLTKSRSSYQSEVADKAKIVVTFDQLPDLGKHSGYYLEIEILVGGDDEIEKAKAAIFELAFKLLQDSRESCGMSYKQMLDDATAEKEAAR